MATLSGMVTNGSQKVAKRLSAAERVRAAMAAQMQAMTAGVDAGIRAHAARQAALAEADAADDRFREAVDALVQVDQSLEDIAELLEVPLSEVRAARRPKGREHGDGEEPAKESADRAPAGGGKPKERPPVPAAAGARGERLGSTPDGGQEPAGGGGQTGEPAA